MRVRSSWRVFWFKAWMISCICLCDRPVGERARLFALLAVGGLLRGVHDGYQVVPCPPLCPFSESSLGPKAVSARFCSPSKEEFTDWEKISNIWLHTLTPPRKVASAQTLLSHCFRVFNPVDVDSQKRTSADGLCVRATDRGQKGADFFRRRPGRTSSTAQVFSSGAVFIWTKVEVWFVIFRSQTQIGDACSKAKKEPLLLAYKKANKKCSNGGKTVQNLQRQIPLQSV